MPRIATAALAALLAVSPIGLFAFPPAQNDAAAGATLKVTNLMPGKSKTFMSGSEFRVCNEGTAKIHVMAGNSMTGTPTEFLSAARQVPQDRGQHDDLRERQQDPGHALRLRRLGRSARPRPRTRLRRPGQLEKVASLHLAATHFTYRLKCWGGSNGAGDRATPPLDIGLRRDVLPARDPRKGVMRRSPCTRLLPSGKETRTTADSLQKQEPAPRQDEIVSRAPPL